MLVSPGVFAAGGGSPPPPSHPPEGAAHPTISSAGLAVHPTVSPSPSGRGTFLTTGALPSPPSTSICTGPPSVAPSCAPVNVSTDPSVTVVGPGHIDAAYTVYTNLSVCGGNFTLSEIAFTTSHDDGGNWSTPVLLGNTQCDPVNATRFANAWEPALTSLPNGTLVLAFVEWSIPAWLYGGGNPFPQLLPNDFEFPATYAGDYNWSRIVVVRSFDDGVRWTPPTVLNQSLFDPAIGSFFAPDNGSASWIDENPTIASVGDTVYLAWQNTSWEFDLNYTLATDPATGDMGVQFVRSTNGGGTWSTPVPMPVIPGNQSVIAANPALLTTPDGEVVISYVTNATTDCIPLLPSCSGRGYYMTPVVGSSSNNGTMWSWSYLPTVFAAPFSFYPYFSPWHIGLQPQLAFDNLTKEVIVAYSYLSVLAQCNSVGCTPAFATGVAVAHSTFANWSFQPASVDAFGPAAGVPFGILPSAFFSPTVAVVPNGTLYLSVGIENQSLTALGAYSTPYTGAQQQLLTWSEDDGATFAAPIVVAGGWSFDTYFPQGLRNAMVVDGSSIDVFWTNPVCPTWASPTSNCYFQVGYSNNGSTVLEFSRLFHGPGTTLTFAETGLPSGTPWSVDVLGNERSGTAPGTLSISGVPTGQAEPFTVSNNTTGGSRYFPIPLPVSPVNVTGPTTVQVTYQAQFLVTIGSDPLFAVAAPPYSGPGYCGIDLWNSPCESLTYNESGTFGTAWYENGTVLSTSFAPIPFQNFSCPQASCQFLNLSFLSWTGIGPGAVASTGLNLTLTVTGPVTETANFLIEGVCNYVDLGVGYTPYASCLPSASTFTFHEVGLPAGTVWGVDLFGTLPNQTAPYVVDSANSSMQVDDPLLWESAYYLPLTVNGSGSTIWVADGTPASPILLPTNGSVVLTYHTESRGRGSLPSVFLEEGLPSGTPWSYSVGLAAYGSRSAIAVANLSFGPASLNASAVDGVNGTGYYVEALKLLPLIPGSSWTNLTSGPGRVDVESSLVVVFVYALMYRLTVAASPGGNVTPSAGWFPGNSSVAVLATADPGYHFVQWTGVGPQSANSTTPSVQVTLRGPVEEFATFQKDPATRFTVAVEVEGLPSSAPVVVTFNGSSYAGAGTFELPTVPSGSYEFEVGAVLANGTTATQYVPTSVTSTFPTAPGGLYEVGSNGTFVVTYQVQYVLTVNAGPNGTASPLGSSWQDEGAVVVLTAAPDPRYQVLGWAGIGNGSV